MSDYGLRFRLLADPQTEDVEAVHLRLFEVLDEMGVAEDISSPDGSGRFNLWLTVTASAPEEALRVGIKHLVEAELSIHRGAGVPPLSLAFLSAEIELDESEDSHESLLAAM
jgi:hypothetical protein